MLTAISKIASLKTDEGAPKRQEWLPLGAKALVFKIRDNEALVFARNGIWKSQASEGDCSPILFLFPSRTTAISNTPRSGEYHAFYFCQMLTSAPNMYLFRSHGAIPIDRRGDDSGRIYPRMAKCSLPILPGRTFQAP